MTPLYFDNALIDTLPGDPEPRVFPRQVQGALWSAVAIRRSVGTSSR